MLRIIFLILTAFLTSGLIIWVIDHEGFVLVNWLGYELKTNIVTAITLSILFTVTFASLIRLANQLEYSLDTYCEILKLAPLKETL